jgi:hypothetical protein
MAEAMKGKRDMKMLVVLFMSVVTFTFAASAQDWVRKQTTNEMTDEKYVLYILIGRGVNEEMNPSLTVACSANKVVFVIVHIEGITFHYDGDQFYKGMGATWTKLRIGNKDAKGKYLQSNKDMSNLLIDKSDFLDITASGEVRILFADAFSSDHMIAFSGVLLTPAIKSDCGL